MKGGVASVPWGMGPWGWVWAGPWGPPGAAGPWGAWPREGQATWLKAQIRMMEDYLAWLKEQLAALEAS